MVASSKRTSAGSPTPHGKGRGPTNNRHWTLDKWIKDVKQITALSDRYELYIVEDTAMSRIYTHATQAKVEIPSLDLLTFLFGQQIQNHSKAADRAFLIAV